MAEPIGGQMKDRITPVKIAARPEIIGTKTLAREEAQIFRQLDTVEAVEHVGCNRTGDNTAKHAGISRCLAAISSAGKCRTSGATTAMVFHHDAVSYDCSQCGYTVVIGEAKRNTDCEDQRHIGEKLNRLLPP